MTKAKRPPGALARGGMAARWRRLARPPLPQPSPGPHPAPRQPGGGVSQGRPRLAPGRGGGGEKRVGTQPGPPCPLAPGRERREQDIPCPGTREGREGWGGELRSSTPSWAGPLPLPPGAGEPIRPPRPLLLQDPMTQRWEQGGGGLGWLLPYRPSPLLPPSFKILPCFPPPTLLLPPSFALPGKGNRNQEGGV